MYEICKHGIIIHKIKNRLHTGFCIIGRRDFFTFIVNFIRTIDKILDLLGRQSAGILRFKFRVNILPGGLYGPNCRGINLFKVFICPMFVQIRYSGNLRSKFIRVFIVLIECNICFGFCWKITNGFLNLPNSACLFVKLPTGSDRRNP